MVVSLFVGIVGEVGVFDVCERLRIANVALSGCRHLEQTVAFDVLMYVSGYHSLPYHWAPRLRRHVFASSELFKLVVMMRHNVVRCASFDKVDDVILTESLLNGKQRTQHNEQCLLAVALHLGMQTVVAVAAIVLGVLLAEVVQQQFAATYRRLGISCGLLKELSADVLFGHWLAFHDLLEFLQVLIRVESEAYALATVASGASSFLIIALQTLRYVVVNDKSHVGFVNAHAECYGSHDDVDALHQEVVLGLRACG